MLTSRDTEAFEWHKGGCWYFSNYKEMMIRKSPVLKALENESIEIFRETAVAFRNL
jgi:hypothetical protein